jgi:hypothetical protein
MPVVQMPDGTFVDMPETLPPEAVLPDSEATRKAKLVGASAVRGAVGLPALGADVAAKASQYLPTTPFGVPPNPQEVTARPLELPMTQKLQDFGPKPKDTLEKYLSSIVEGVGGGLTGGPAGGLRSAAIGGVSGLGAETGAQVSGDEDAFLPRLLGGLAGGGLGALFSGRLGPSPRVQELARESLDGITPKQINEARSFMQAAELDGVRLDAAQALEGVGASPAGLRVLRDTLANVKEGDQTLKLLRGQPAAIQERGATWLATNPGNIYSPEQAANNLSEAATGVIAAAKHARTEAVRPHFAAAGPLGRTFRTEFLNDLADTLQTPGLTDHSVSAIKSAMQRVRKLPATGTAADMADDYNEIIRGLRGPYKGNPQTPLDSRSRGQIGPLAAKLTERLREASPEIKTGMALHAQISRDVVDPLKQGPIGGLATKAGYRGDVQASVAKMNALFSAGRDPAARHSPLLAAARKLNKQDPEAFRDAAKTYYSRKISAAFDADIGGAKPTNKDAAERIYRDLFSNQPQYTGMKDAVTAAAESAGVPPAEALRGLDNFAKIVKAARSQPDQLGGMTKQQIIEMAEKHHGANFVRIFGFLPFERMARNLESATMSKTLREMDKLITTPEGLKILAELSKQPVMSRQALALAATAGGVLSQMPKTAQSTE